MPQGPSYLRGLGPSPGADPSVGDGCTNPFGRHQAIEIGVEEARIGIARFREDNSLPRCAA